MKKIRITKRRDKALDIALSLDDYLYEKFRRQQNEVRRLHEQYVSNPKRIWSVVERLPDGNYLNRKIVNVEVCDEGSRIIIEGCKLTSEGETK